MRDRSAHPARPTPSPIGGLLAAVGLLVACSAQVETPVLSASGLPSVDEAVPVVGVPDRGADPAVVAIDAGGQMLCGGALIAPDVVLTAARCVALATPSSGCPGPPSRAPQTLRVLTSEVSGVAVERARGADVVAPPEGALCGPDVALILLDTPIEDVAPLAVRATGAARGDRVRTVGYRPTGVPGAPIELVRDHLLVIDSSAAELKVAEACEEAPGGPAMDEATCEVVAVASHGGGASCGGGDAFDVYERADANAPLIQQALAKSAFLHSSTRGTAKTTKGSVDLGANCVRGADCAAGVCVSEGDHEYCSCPCDTQDPCPARYRCRKSSRGDSVCLEQ